ncbi:serine/threonine-protein phosphatase 6 regulatory ankyrin repeat subunit [Thalictrum thalictroides]|uniref:Serine/threonine-protein phosphatase 6 regulatory ankyrin repeat subunit n=1 Tax=Thalictrum thalictroides TaxID=46969 RepID=A0A7J6WS84_THATH|nr:serine/threonine-protein phosphatase 6 regulatory ankyrin repeat subunit [Thalictrum thalictroides]
MQETLIFDLDRSFPKSIYGSGKDEIFYSTSPKHKFDDVRFEKIDPVSAEKSLIELIVRDDKDRLVSELKTLFEYASNQENLEEKDLALRLLHLCCHLDSVQCAEALIDGEIGPGIQVNQFDGTGRTALHCAAEMHAKRCIELLLRRKARTDLRSKDDNAQLPIEIVLSSERMIVWNTDQTTDDLLISLSEMDLSVVKMLTEKTRDIADIAYSSAMEGDIVSLAALLMVIPEKVMASIMVLRPDGGLASKETTTIYECLIREAMYLGQKEGSPKASKGTGLLSKSERRRFLLCEIEVLQFFGATFLQRSSAPDRRVISPLIRASQAGDEEVLKLILKTNIDVNETDGEGNSALHWYLKSSSNTKKLSVLLLLMKHGANISQRTSLGLTPVHIAASNGYCEALQILLLKDSNSVDAVSKLKETPLFFAVKNDFINCAQLLLRYGANTQILNLRKQRPIDLAKSQDMRFLLNQNIQYWSQPIRLKENTSWVNDYQSDSVGEMFKLLFDNKTETLSAKILSPIAKTKVCKYLRSPGGCVNGANCLFAHGEEELSWRQLRHQSEKLERKVFVGGLPQNFDSDMLREFFEDKFGIVEDAVVIRSQEGNQVHSRGFGFVTFKNKDSVAAAVQLHYISIGAKNVEIKGAVSKSDLLSEALKTKSKDDQESQGAAVPNRVQVAEESHEHKSLNQPRLKINLSSKDQSLPSWVITLVKWLPGFLKDVYRHLKKGEWYALSSLKLDFKTNCGLKLDHSSIGYSKLSDFMESFPGICHMKLVPLNGRGPASHMVLLPSLQLPPKHSEFLQLMESNGQYDSPSVDETDDDDATSSCLPDFMAMEVNANSSHVGSVQGTSPGSAQDSKQVEKGKGTTSNLDPRLNKSVDWDEILYGQPSPQNKGHEVGKYVVGGHGGQGNTNYALLMVLSSEKFSYFARQPDFFKEYRNKCLHRSKCFRCKNNEMRWANYPCGHVLWCNDCLYWIYGEGPRSNTCVICNAKVERCLKASPRNEQKSPGSTTPDNVAFPPWDLKTASTIPR